MAQLVLVNSASWSGTSAAPIQPVDSRKIVASLFALLGLVVSILVLVLETEQAGTDLWWQARTNETLLLVLAAATTLLVVHIARRGPPRRGAVVALVVIAMVAGLLYFYGQRGASRRHFAKWHDTFHYILGAKYFTELGYFELYDCVATAHIANQPAAGRRPWKVRDLRTYALIDVTDAVSRTPCAERLGPARWAELRGDVALFHRHKSIPSLLRDHGYNGSPTHTFFARALANAVPLTYDSVTRLALIDVALLSLMFAAVTLAFGVPLGALFAILFFVNFSDRFYFIGGSMMRYAWMVALTAGIAMLRLSRHRAAGALMTTAALLNVFPLLFLAGVGVRIAFSWLRSRRVSSQHRRFVAAAIVTAAIGLGVGASHSGGTKNYSEFLGFIGGHSQKLTSSRTGLRYTVLHRSAEPGSRGPGYKRKGRELAAAAPFLVALGGLMLVAGVALCSRLDDVEASVLLGFLLFYVLFGTVEYYYAVTPLLLFAFHRRWQRDRLAAGMIAALFATMTVVLLIWRQSRSLMLCNNTIMSAALLSFLSATLVYVAARTDRVRCLRGRALAAALAGAALLGPAVTVSAWLLYN